MSEVEEELVFLGQAAMAAQTYPALPVRIMARQGIKITPVSQAHLFKAAVGVVGLVLAELSRFPVALLHLARGAVGAVGVKPVQQLLFITTPQPEAHLATSPEAQVAQTPAR